MKKLTIAEQEEYNKQMESRALITSKASYIANMLIAMANSSGKEDTDWLAQRLLLYGVGIEQFNPGKFIFNGVNNIRENEVRVTYLIEEILRQLYIGSDRYPGPVESLKKLGIRLIFGNEMAFFLNERCGGNARVK